MYLTSADFVYDRAFALHLGSLANNMSSRMYLDGDAMTVIDVYGDSRGFE